MTIVSQVTDKPHPRGEVCLSGVSVAKGYYNQSAKTEESFFMGNDGKRWFKTGDIGQFDDEGMFFIISLVSICCAKFLKEYPALIQLQVADNCLLLQAS